MKQLCANLRFNRLELAGSLGDLGTLLPIAVAMVMVNGLSAVGVFYSVGLFFLFSGLYFRVTVPVQPMKVIGAYAIATAMEPAQILASSLLLGALLLVIGLTNTVALIDRITPKAVIRGAQLSTGALLIAGGARFIFGTSPFQVMAQAAEPWLAVERVAAVPVGLLIGAAGVLVTFLLLDSRRFPAGLVVVGGGLLLGSVAGVDINLTGEGGWLHFPQLFPFGLPGGADFTFALFALVLPQIPMTMGNAVLAYTDLSRQYFGDRAARVTNRNTCISMGLANLLSFCVGGMPLCHGAGGLAAHYRFGARTAGSNLMIGLLFLVLALFFGEEIINILHLLPMSILGVLLLFSGAQLTLAIIDLEDRKEYFVATLILGVTLASNLGIGCLTGLMVAWILRAKSVSV